MSIQEHHCVTLRCDGCGEQFDSEDGYTPHWPTAEEAYKTLADEDWGCDGWRITADADLCGQCGIRRDHEANGHDWGDWRAVESSGIEGLERRLCIYIDGGEEYRRHGQPLDHDAVRALLAEVRATSRPGDGGAAS